MDKDIGEKRNAFFFQDLEWTETTETTETQLKGTVPDMYTLKI